MQTEENLNNNTKSFMQNREVSWLKFNERVLSEAIDSTVPIIERLKFISIFSSNLDEFFMIRVGSLSDLLSMKSNLVDARTGMDITAQLKAIYKETSNLYKEKDDVYEIIEKELNSKNIYDLKYEELDAKEQKIVKQYFKNDIMPILSPQIVDFLHPFPHINNKLVCVATILKHKKEEVFGLIPVPQSLPKVLFLNENSSTIRYIRIENIISSFVQKAFSHYTVEELAIIRVTRNADLNFDDEDFNVESVNNDFRKKMKKLLTKRKRLAPVRLEISKDNSTETDNETSQKLQMYLQEKLSITKRQVFYTKAPMELDFVFSLQSKLESTEMKNNINSYIYEEFTATTSREINPSLSIIQQIKEKDLLLSFPFESMKPFLNLLKEAIYDESVLSIKMTIYRVDSKGKIIEYLCQAAENGKEVTVLIELRARFDEQNNIGWSERLEEAGCNIIYGFKNYKVHSKVCLITKKENNEIKYISQIGTGNYNEKTSKIYTDVSLMTFNQDIGRELNEFFRNMGIANLKGEYEHLLVAPFGLKSSLIELIKKEGDKGSSGRILIKINSLTDTNIIKELRNASCKGAKITLIIRGICCMLPEVENNTENIQIINIVSRFLEHTRIYVFGEDNAKMYISSADFMTRNTEKRVEVACPIYDEQTRQKIYDLLEACMKDNVKGRMLKNNGEYMKKDQTGTLFDSQQQLINKSKIQ